MQAFYVITMGIFKISLGLFFLRILVARWARRVVYGVLFAFSLYSVGYFFFVVFGCGVPGGGSYWMRKIANECASDSITLGLGYALAILTAGTDLIFLM